MTMRQRLAHIALAVGCMAAGCDGAEVHPIWNPGLILAQPADLLPSNSGVLLIFNGKMNINTFKGELRPGCAEQSANIVQGDFEAIDQFAPYPFLGSSSWALYWKAGDPLPLGEACLYVEGFDFPYYKDKREGVKLNLDMVVVDPDNEPPRFLGAQFFEEERLPLIEVKVALQFSETVLWDRMVVEYGEPDDVSPYKLTLEPQLYDLTAEESASGKAFFHASIDDLEENKPYRIAVRDIYDLAENRGEDASVLIQYERKR